MSVRGLTNVSLPLETKSLVTNLVGCLIYKGKDFHCCHLLPSSLACRWLRFRPLKCKTQKAGNSQGLLLPNRKVGRAASVRQCSCCRKQMKKCIQLGLQLSENKVWLKCGAFWKDLVLETSSTRGWGFQGLPYLGLMLRLELGVQWLHGRWEGASGYESLRHLSIRKPRVLWEFCKLQNLKLNGRKGKKRNGLNIHK